MCAHPVLTLISFLKLQLSVAVAQIQQVQLSRLDRLKIYMKILHTRNFMQELLNLKNSCGEKLSDAWNAYLQASTELMLILRAILVTRKVLLSSTTRITLCASEIGILQRKHGIEAREEDVRAEGLWFDI
ncbi:hypothetical protein EDC01DRAFT_632273 [Geopyxis carbonaria]|nr:hypothetical protein EDC01DRAFT_632273 [Geopyxis carbonaria]